jgi:hypothetical protein
MRAISDCLGEHEQRRGESGRGALLAKLALALVWPSSLAFAVPFLAPVSLVLALRLHSAAHADLAKCRDRQIHGFKKGATEEAYRHATLSAYLSLLALVLWIAFALVVVWFVVLADALDQFADALD